MITLYIEYRILVFTCIKFALGSIIIIIQVSDVKSASGKRRQVLGSGQRRQVSVR